MRGKECAFLAKNVPLGRECGGREEAICVGVYFLIPVLNKKQYREQRENLKKREAAFQSNIRRTDGSTATAQAAATPEAPAEETALPEADKPSGRGEE